MENTNPLRILFVEDLPSDAILAEREIRKSGLEFSSKRVDSKVAFLKALEEFHPDVIVSDYSMPGFDGMQALKLSLERDSRIPFILLTGSMNEETAVACMKAGASDYVIKEHMSRLPFAVREAIHQKKMRVARDESERALSESENKYRILVDNANEAIVVVQDGLIKFVNRNAMELTGYSEQEFAAKPFTEFIHPDDRNIVVENYMKRVKGEPVPIRYSFRVITVEGNVRWVETGAAILKWQGKPATLNFLTDITERRRAEDEIALLAHTVKSISECVSITDLNETVLFVNAAFVKTYGYEENEILGKNINIVRSLNVSPESAKGIGAATLEGGWHGELLNRTKDGREFPVSISTSVLRDSSGQPTGLVGVAEDITERKRAEQELEIAYSQLSHLYNNLPEALFAVDMVHNKMLQVSPAHMEVFGYPPEEFYKDSQLWYRLIIPEDKSIVDAGFPLLSAGKKIGHQFRIIDPQGKTRWIEAKITPTLAKDGTLIRVDGIASDITERKEAERDLRLSEERFRSVWDNSADGMRLTDREGRIVDVNAAFCRLMKLSREDLVGKSLSVAYQRQGPDDDLRLYHQRFEARETLSDLLISGTLWNGETIYLHISSSYIETTGQQRLLLSLFYDVTEQKRAEKRLDEERTLLRTIIDAIPDEICVKDIERKFVLVNPGTMRALKRPSSEIIGKRDEDLIPEKFALRAREEEESVLKSGLPYLNIVGDSRINPLSGEIERSILISKIPLKDDWGKVVGLVGINRDITEVQRTNAALEKERTLLLTLLENIPDEICLKDIAHRFIVVNSGIVRAIGARSIQDMMGKTDADFMSPELAAMHFEEEDAILTSGRPIVNLENIVLNPMTGEIEKCKLTTKVLVKDRSGKEIGILVVNRNVTERKKAEEALRASERKYRLLFEESKDVVYISTADGKLLDMNPAGIELFGYGSTEELSQIDLVMGYADPGMKQRFDLQMEHEGFVKDFEVVFKRADGKIIQALETATAVRDKNGKIVEYRGIIRDVTSQRLLETQFIQAQKMESIGTLAGGIAHDFNNILGIVLGHMALLERTRENKEQFDESIFSITRAVDRGASLVRQILTFARRNETEIEPVNINLAIKELTKMLGETFPKTLEITQKLDKTIPVVLLDPTQLHQALLNLCVNARDAMNGQGVIALATHLVTGSDVSKQFPTASAHHYVQVSVKDTGTGMDEETRRHIFEPFFTTKEKGKGTGLGLAVVYGVLQAHRGFIDVESAPGAGTTFQLYFPVPEGIIMPTEKQEGPKEDLPRGTETILVVEDEDILRDLLVKLLVMQGYTVIPASDGEEAFMRFSEHAEEIDLVVSDMGLPKRSGWDAYRMMQKINPKARILLASGYIEPALKAEILKSDAVKFIHKPYKIEQIIVAVREALDFRR